MIPTSSHQYCKTSILLGWSKAEGGCNVEEFLLHRNIWDLPDPQQDHDEDTNDDLNVH